MSSMDLDQHASAHRVTVNDASHESGRRGPAGRHQARLMLHPMRRHLPEHNPRNPVARDVVSHCALDEDAALLGRAAAIGLLRQAGLRPGGSGYVTFRPRPFAPIERLEWTLGWLPAGAQYHAWVTRTDRAASPRPAEPSPS